jgi:predicted amidohydrolase
VVRYGPGPMSAVDRTGETSWWALTCTYLERFARTGRDLPTQQPDARYDAWMETSGAAHRLLDQGDAHAPAPWDGLAEALGALVAEAPEADEAAHAVAATLDQRFSATFCDDWIAAADGPFDLADGDLYPVLDTPWGMFHPFLSRTASMTDPRHGELAHVRRFASSALPSGKVRAVRVHPVTGLLRDVLTTLATIATAHPNVTAEELTWPEGRRLWPVTLRDPARQADVVARLVTAALDGGSRLVVLPELSATDATIAAVQALLDARYEEDEDPALVLAGTRHLELATGERVNRATTLIAASPTQLHQDKLVPFRVGEAIEDLNGDRVVHLYQDGPFRLATAVCKDLLDADVEAVLERLAVNLLLVPAMSPKTSNFPLAAARLLHTAQTVTVVANCPLVEDGVALAHCSLTGRPTADADPVASWPLGGHHARPPAGPVWVGHPLPAGPPSGHPLVA